MGNSEMGRPALKFVGQGRKEKIQRPQEREGIKKRGGGDETGEKRVRLCENRRARSQTTSPLYIQPEQLETRDHRREREKITLPHYSNHFLENEACLSLSLSLFPYLFSSLSSVHGGGNVCVPSLSAKISPRKMLSLLSLLHSPPAGLNDSPRSVTPLVSLSITLPNPSGIDTLIDCRMLSTHPTSCGREEEKEGGRAWR